MLDQQYGEIISVVPIPLFEDNYSYLVYGNPEGGAAIVDPGDCSPIINFLESNEFYKGLKITHLLITHKHWDHAGGAEKLKETLIKSNPDLLVVSGEAEKLDYSNLQVNEDVKTSPIFANSILTCYKVPCHTLGHLLFKIETNSKLAPSTKKSPIKNSYQTYNCLFTGDTLFIGGCGKFFEGTADQMHKNLSLIKGMNDDTHIFCGHEYTVSNLEWALGIEVDNDLIATKLKEAKNLISKNLPTVPSTVREEKQINVFLRWDSQSIKKHFVDKDEVEVLGLLRKMKNEKKSFLINKF